MSAIASRLPQRLKKIEGTSDRGCEIPLRRAPHIAGLVLLAVPLVAGPLGFESAGPIGVQKPVVDCGPCVIMTSLQTMATVHDPRASAIIAATIASLTVIGLIGLSVRMRP